FMLFLRRRAITAGAYELSPHLSAWSLSRVVTTTQARPERTVTIIEGWSIRDIGAYLEREGIGSPDELYAIVGIPATDYRHADPEIPRPIDLGAEYPFLVEKPEFIGLEGYLFPDTYRVYADTSVEDIVYKMLDNLSVKLTDELLAEIAASGRSLHQVLTLASLVEKEVSNEEDRPIVAGILWKRRDRGWLLQADSTVNYVTGKSDPRTRIADHSVDSSFNTYRYAGLPRGPISNPGMASILAALRPQESPYWFFLTTPDGETKYGRSLAEHNTNIARYLK
ncbi:MAG: endolytic transglycosylase MltG, partial [Candidatus Uhrbacteria bacterium]